MFKLIDKHLNRLIGEVQKSLADIHDTRRALQPPLIRQALDLLAEGLSYARDKLAHLDSREVDYADHPGRDPDAPLLRSRLRTMEFLSIGFDVPLQAVMVKVAVDLSWLPNLVIGACVAIGGALLARAGILWWSHVPNMTRRSIRRCKAVAKAVGVVILLCLAVLVVSRVAGADIIRQFDLESWSLVAFSLLTEGLVVLAGSLGAAASWYSESDEFDEHRRELRTAILWMEKTQEEVERLLRKFDDDLPPEPASLNRPKTPLRPVGDAAAAFVAIVLSAGNPLGAQGYVRAEPNVLASGVGYVIAELGAIAVSESHTGSLRGARAETVSQSRARCGVFIDITLSGDTAARREAVGRFATDLDDFVRSGRCEVLELLWFTDRPAWAPRRYFALPAPHGLADCERVPRPPSQGLAGVFRTLKGFDNYALQEARRACQADSIAGISVWERALAPVREALRALPPPEPGRRTALNMVIRDIVGTTFYSRAAVFTDGLDTTDSATVPDEVPAELDLTLVLFPARPEYGGELASARAGDEWARRIRRLHVLSYRELGAPFLWEGREGLVARTPRAVGR